MKRHNALEMIDILYKTGLLFEINRRVLHPLGYAMYIGWDDDTGELDQTGMYEVENDPEGIYYEKEAFQEGYGKYTKYLEEEGQEKLDARVKALGYVEQTEGNLDE